MSSAFDMFIIKANYNDILFMKMAGNKYNWINFLLNKLNQVNKDNLHMGFIVNENRSIDFILENQNEADKLVEEIKKDIKLSFQKKTIPGLISTNGLIFNSLTQFFQLFKKD